MDYATNVAMNPTHVHPIWCVALTLADVNAHLNFQYSTMETAVSIILFLVDEN